jgi:EAL domain-containing protein (putative c-di-GMP-specific phosphodiesterase class I)
VTESALFERGPGVAQVLSRLRELQLQLHLDDFGTGYSSLSYLHRMPVEALKIDRSFVASMGEDPVCASIVQAIITLAQTLRIKSIAEGVETREQAEQLRKLRCDFAQGYLFGRPLSAEEFFRWCQTPAAKAS